MKRNHLKWNLNERNSINNAATIVVYHISSIKLLISCDYDIESYQWFREAVLSENDRAI